MSIDLAIRLTEIMIGIAFVQQSIEHLKMFNDERVIFLPRLILSILLIAGFQAVWVVFLLLGLGLATLNRFQGPYNGGADRMSILIICCLCGAHIAPSSQW